MSKQGDAAYAWFLKGYNCSQSVVAAFAPQLGLTEEMALRLSAGFGAGIGRMREVCGAFCGVVTVSSAGSCWQRQALPLLGVRRQRTAPQTIIKSDPARSCAASAPTCVQNLLRRTRRDGTDYIRRMRKCSLNNWN